MGKKVIRIPLGKIKPRDPFRVGLIERKKGPHKDTRLEEDKTKCRKKVKEENEG